MSKLEELKSLVAEMFNKATEKGDIENLSKVNECVNEIEKDEKELMRKHTELLKDYKDVIKHTSFSSNNEIEENAGVKTVDFYQMLEKYKDINKNK